MTQDKKSPKRIVLPPKKRPISLAHYRSKAVRGVTLDPKEARIVQGYLESLVKIQREEREMADAQDLSAMSDVELLRLAKRVLENNNTDTIDKNERSNNESE